MNFLTIGSKMASNEYFFFFKKVRKSIDRTKNSESMNQSGTFCPVYHLHHVYKDIKLEKLKC